MNNPEQAAMYNCLLRLKVLVVDYDQFVADLLANIVTGCGHNVTTTIDPHEALDLIRDQYQQNNPFDLVFTEFMLTNMTGIDFCKKLLKIDAGITIVMVTGDNSIEAKKQLAQYGHFSGYLSKAEDVTEVAYHLNIAMSNKKEKLSGEKSEYLKRMKSTQK